MNLDQLRQRVRDLSGVRQTELSPDPRLNDLLNEAYLELAGVENWPWLYLGQEAVVPPEQSEVALDTEMRTIDGALFDGERLHNVTVADIDEARRTEPDEPYAYARLDASRLLLVPPPKSSGVLKVRGYRQVERLEVDTDEPIFDAEFHHLLAYVSAARLLIEEADDSERAEFYAEQVRDGVHNMRSRYIRAHERSPLQLGARSARRPRWRL